MSHLVLDNLDWIITVDRDRRVIRNGRIAIRDGRILAVGKAKEPYQFADAEIIDGRGLIAVPGLIDSSVAAIQQLGRGLGDLCDIPQYRLERVMPYEASMSTADAECAIRHCCLEMTRSGTTFFVDTGSRFPEQIAGIAAASGLRAIVGRSCQDIFDTPMGNCPPELKRETLSEVVAEAERAIGRVIELGQKQITPCIAIPWLTGCSDELGAALAVLSAKHDVPIVVSAAASRDEAVLSRIHFGKTEIKRLSAMGLLTDRTIVSHAGWTSPDDLRIIQLSGATVACCPSMSHRLGTGTLEQGRFPELLAFGANVTLGSGSAMASNFVDVARQLYFFSGGNKTYRLDATVTRPETSIEMATVRAARALRRSSDLGSIEAGMHADITAFRCTTSDWVPVISPIQNLVFSSRGGADMVLVGGQVLLRHGRPTLLDEHEILANSQAAAEALAVRSKLNRFAAPAWKVLSHNHVGEA